MLSVVSGKQMLRRFLLVIAGAALLTAMPFSIRAIAVSFDDPNVFGYGEAWSPPSELRVGSTGHGVVQLQRRLGEIGFRPGPVDGRYGEALSAAVVAFQKAHGLPRDGIFRSADWRLLDEPISVGTASAPDRVEIDLGRQVLFLIENQTVASILPISSGSGSTYRSRGGGLSKARTPEGAFSFYRHVDGWRISYLGGLYEPYYFRGGYAIHGSGSVPAYPASHGCVRVRIPDMNYLLGRLRLGMPVYVYGDTSRRSDVITPLETPAIERVEFSLPAELAIA
ncbi:hypothetical protein BMS3Abin02_02075 [bacterium BMS3Abin02]|nr:hypothetical protein BMS3Abin02_02075 [bacterium BMS3Abin02]GBE21413.1 hypothetical protein BMS3Bbin01_00758 [bacterium BMS3Bbin01]HDH25918.1 murein L,D-transpeptidase [Actinomycetota bacterium]